MKSIDCIAFIYFKSGFLFLDANTICFNSFCNQIIQQPASVYKVDTVLYKSQLLFTATKNLILGINFLTSAQPDCKCR